MAVVADEEDHPFKQALRNASHDAKLRSWKAKTTEEK